MKLLLPLLAAAMLAGCTTPYPNGAPFYGAEVSGNAHPRGSEGFCRTYARQTAGNAYEGNRDSEDGFGRDLFTAEQARQAGERAYARCRAGRTN